MNVLSTLLAPFVAVGVMLGTLFSPQVEPLPGASEAVPVVVAFFETTLASGISSTQTSFTLTSATDKDGNTLASSTYAFVIDEGSANEEIVIADCTGTACTNALRGVSAVSGNTEVTALKKLHRRGSTVKITDAPILMLVSRAMRGEDVTNFTPVGNGSLVDKQYVDGVALGSGAVPSTYTDDGILELATGTQAASSTATDQSGSPLALHTGISTSTAPTSGSYVVVTGADGNIADDIINPLTWLLVASGTNAMVYSTTSTTTNHTATWTKPYDVDLIRVQLWGAGGSGGRWSAGYAGGGGGGAYNEFIFDADSIASEVLVTVGVGGACVNSNVAGNPGGNSSFGTYIYAYGGGGGGADSGANNGGGGGGGGWTSAGATGTASTGGNAGGPTWLNTSTVGLSAIAYFASGTNPTGVVGRHGLYSSGGGSGITNNTTCLAGDTVYGGAGGGGTCSTASVGGTSLYGGSGGAGGANSGLPSDGSVPGGGGGGADSAVCSGRGGNGKVIVTAF